MSTEDVFKLATAITKLLKNTWEQPIAFHADMISMFIRDSKSHFDVQPQ